LFAIYMLNSSGIYEHKINNYLHCYILFNILSILENLYKSIGPFENIYKPILYLKNGNV